MARSAIDRRLVVEVVTRWGLSRRDAAAVVRFVLEQVAADLRRCRVALVDPDLAMGVGVAIARLCFAGDRVGGRAGARAVAESNAEN